VADCKRTTTEFADDNIPQCATIVPFQPEVKSVYKLPFVTASTNETADIRTNCVTRQ